MMSHQELVQLVTDLQKESHKNLSKRTRTLLREAAQALWAQDNGDDDDAAPLPCAYCGARGHCDC